MKKLVLVALVAATSAFAMTDGKSLVELNGCFDGGRCDNLDFNMQSDDQDDEVESTTIALNYNWLFTNNFGAGINFAQRKSTVGGDVQASSETEAMAIANDAQANSQTMGVNLFWNFAGGWESSYVAVRYSMTSTEESEDETLSEGDITTTTLEYGKRMTMGKVFGLALHYSPSVSYAMTNYDFDGSDEIAATELRLNVANFAVSF